MANDADVFSSSPTRPSHHVRPTNPLAKTLKRTASTALLSPPVTTHKGTQKKRSTRSNHSSTAEDDDAEGSRTGLDTPPPSSPIAHTRVASASSSSAVTGKRKRVAPAATAPRLFTSSRTRSNTEKTAADLRALAAIRESVERSPSPPRTLPSSVKTAVATTVETAEHHSATAVVSDSESDAGPVVPETPRRVVASKYRYLRIPEPRTPSPKHRRRPVHDSDDDEDDVHHLTPAGPVRDSPSNPFLGSTPQRPGTPPPGGYVEKPTITYVFRGVKATFANPLYNLPAPKGVDPSTLSPSHPDFSPAPVMKPTVLFAPRTPTTRSKSRAEEAAKAKMAALLSDGEDDDSDDIDLEAPRVARRLFTSGAASSSTVVASSSSTAKPSPKQATRSSPRRPTTSTVPVSRPFVRTRSLVTAVEPSATKGNVRLGPAAKAKEMRDAVKLGRMDPSSAVALAHGPVRTSAKGKEPEVGKEDKAVHQRSGSTSAAASSSRSPRRTRRK